MLQAESASRYERHEIGSGEPIESESLVEFRLLYEGELLASGNDKTRPNEKHAIRRSLHPQLRRLWNVHKGLQQLAQSFGTKVPPHGGTEQERFDRGIRAIGANWAKAGFSFVPLVTAEHAMRCSLDILLLRPEEDRFIFTRGDIDGQVKTLFDALRLPANLTEAGGAGPQEDETPFFCLLEDDRLISDVRVSADQLLLLPNQRVLKANDCFVVIHVKLNYKNPGVFDRYLG